MEPPTHDRSRPHPGAALRAQAVERLGRFPITSMLGEGGMGLVYSAVDPALDRRVAIKVIRHELIHDGTARERFLREARLVADLADPHICRVYEVGEDAGRLFIVMELLEGEPLSARLRRGLVPLAAAVPILLDVLSALQTLHGRGIVHRDLKPSNVFLTPTGARLVDFGIARQLADPAGETRAELTAAGIIVGTPRYMAPEQLLGGLIDGRADLFAAGCIFYELLSGRAAFEDASLAGAMARLLSLEAPSLGGSPSIDAADRVIQRALSRTPSDRYPSAAAMADDVRTLIVYGGAGEPGIVPEVRAPARSLAVLPFAGIGSDADEFADGMTEDVIAQLSKIRSLRVIARASVMSFRGREQAPRAVGERLGVRALLDGSVRRAGTRVRIVVQLLDAATESSLWSGTYDRELTDIFGIQAEVAGEIARALEAELTSSERDRLGRRPTENVAAYHQYLKGRHCLLKYTADGVRQAFAFLEQAIDEDPRFALGQAWLALAHVIAGMGYGGRGVPPRESYRAAREAAECALALDPDLGDAHGALAFVRLVMDFDWIGSEREFRRALELTPGSDLMWSAYGLLLSARGRYDEALAAYRRAQQLDPLTAVHSSTLAATLLRAGRTAEALEEARRLIELQPDFPMARSNLGWALLKLGEAEAGLAELEKAVAIAPGNTMFLGQLGHAYALAGRMGDARGVLQRLAERSSAGAVTPYHLAYVHAALGEHDAALDCLERAYETRDGGIYGIKGSFLFADLASHPRFAALLRKMNLEDDQSHTGGHDAG